MKVLVVNDCAHVMEDLIPYLSSKFEIQFLQRTRELWSKTFGILWKIAKSEGDLWHVNYALQDAYIVSKLKHLDVLHCHGSDVRWTIHSKKYGWIVKRNLKKAEEVLYGTPDLESAVKQYREDAIYLPTPVRTDVFAPKQHYNNPLKAVYFKLSYETLPLGLDLYLKENNIALDILEKKIPYQKMSETLRQYDIFIGCFSIPWFTKTCLEAMSMGLATIDYRHNPFDRVDKLSQINLKTEGERNRQFILKNHDAKKVAEQLSGVWESFAS
jgi:hypothetical protein